jgi:D-alanyl-D-alanine carboxypeptidase
MMNAGSYSRIRSETKTFTVTAVLQLADQGKASLDGVPTNEVPWRVH